MALPAALIGIARGASYLKKLNNLRKLKKAQQAGKAFEAKLKNPYFSTNPTLREPTSKLGTVFKGAAANTAAESIFDLDVLPGFDELFSPNIAQAPTTQEPNLNRSRLSRADILTGKVANKNSSKDILKNKILKRKYKSSKP